MEVLLSVTVMLKRQNVILLSTVYGTINYTLKQKWMNVLPKQQCFISPPIFLHAVNCR